VSDFIKILFDRQLADVLDPDELIYVAIRVESQGKMGDSFVGPGMLFYETSAYRKLFDYYIDEMPYGIAKCRTGEPDSWILNRLRE